MGGQHGVAERAVLSFRDITDRIAAQEERVARERTEAELRVAEAQRELTEARALHEATVMNLLDGLAVTDLHDRVELLNPRLADLLGVDIASVVGRPVLEVKAGMFARARDPREALAAEIEGLTAARTGQVKVLRLSLKGPSQQDLVTVFFPVRGGDGNVRAVGCLVRDVTKERESDRLKDELVSTVSHELRTPLASLIGFTELLLAREWPEARRREFLETMLREGKRLTELINDFLDLQRLEAGAVELHPRAINLATLLRSATAVAAADPSHPLKLEVAEDLPSVQADPERVEQVVANLLSNARKYSPGGGSIAVSARLDGAMVEVAVTDSGVGLPPSAVPKLFERFYRVDSADRRNIGGTGLGLAICKSIVEASGGTIHAESAGPGLGSTFAFTLPLAAAGACEATVLLVDDGRGSAGPVEQALERRGFVVRVLRSGSETLQALGDACGAVSAVMLDPSLEEVRHLRATEPTMPIVVLTASSLSEQDQAELEELGVQALSKNAPRVGLAAADLLTRAPRAAAV